MTNFKIEDFNWEKGIFLNTLRQQNEIIQIPEGLLKKLKSYIGLRKKGFLFLNQYREQMKLETVKKIFAKARKYPTY
mgnify:CR=1 FL=1